MEIQLADCTAMKLLQLVSHRPHLALILHTPMESQSPSPGLLHFVFTAKLKRGIPLPSTPEVSLVNPVLKVNQVSVTSHWIVYTPIGRHIDGLMANKNVYIRFLSKRSASAFIIWMLLRGVSIQTLLHSAMAVSIELLIE